MQLRKVGGAAGVVWHVHTLIGAKLPTDVRKFLTVERKQYLAANLLPNTNDAILCYSIAKYFHPSRFSHRIAISSDAEGERRLGCK